MRSVPQNRPLGLRSALRRGLASWMAACALTYGLLSPQARSLAGEEAVSAVAPAGVALAAVLLLAGLTLLSRRMDTRALERWMMPGAFLAASVQALTASFGWELLLLCAAVLTILIVYALRGWQDAPEPAPALVPPGRLWPLMTALAAAAAFLFLGLWGTCRVLSFSSPTYDMGIFSQMFHSMGTTGLPMTTLERDVPLSHFAIHVSPIYYLMLPLYRLWPSPVCLQLQQAAVTALAALPLWKLGGLHGLTGWQRSALCAALLCFPALAGAGSYDLHENAFLTLLVLWLMWAADSRCIPALAAASVLTLAVKEDAAVYVAVIALWMAVRGLLRRDRWLLYAGGALLAGALLWFLAATGALARGGWGVMTDRFGNLMPPGESSLLYVIRTALTHPMKVLHEMATADKLAYMGLTLLPLAGLPLTTRRYERLLLLIPYGLMHLMSDYPYQHSIFFQYSYGSAALLFYLVTVNLAELRGRRFRPVLPAVLCLCALLFGWKILPKAAKPMEGVRTAWPQLSAVHSALARIPAQASVSADTFFTVALSSRERLYDIDYTDPGKLYDSDYIVLSWSEERFGPGGRALLQRGYRLLEQVEGRLRIYKKAA